MLLYSQKCKYSTKVLCRDYMYMSTMHSFTTAAVVVQGDEQLKQQREHTKQEELAKLFNASKNCNGAVAVNGTT